MDSTLAKNIHDHIAASPRALLAIVREDGAATIRPIGAFAPAAGETALDIYFATPRDSAKFRALAANPVVNFYFQDETRPPAAYKAASVIGVASLLESGAPEHDAAVAAIAARSPFFKSRVDSGDLTGTAIVKVRATEARYSDYAAAHAIQEIVPGARGS